MLTCFTAYDIRGRVGVDLDEGIALRIGRAFAETLGARRVVLARDVRPSSRALARAAAQGAMAAGAEVLDLGLAGTEEMYFATGHLGADGGICITASHNPADYNGMKLVRDGAAPLGDGVFAALADRAARAGFAPDRTGGRLSDARAVRRDYVAHVLGMVDLARLRPMRILVNSGNGAAGPTFDAIAAALAKAGAPLTFARLHHRPDGTFPNGVPNPLLAENRPATERAVRAAGADMGVAFDGDFDRCFLFDETGSFVAGEHVVALLASHFLRQQAGAAVVHDPRVVFATRAAVADAGGRAVMARTGHAYMKQALRESGAVYGGEMSAHHYFRDFYGCDSGMIPWLAVAGLMGRTGKSLSALVAELRASFPSSGEINFRVADPAKAIARVNDRYAAAALEADTTDGLSLDFGAWRLNLRASNTEPLLRLNVEARARPDLVTQAVADISALVSG